MKKGYTPKAKFGADLKFAVGSQVANGLKKGYAPKKAGFAKGNKKIANLAKKGK